MSQEKRVLFSENPYDLETIFQSLEIAGSKGKELLYMDRLISNIRIDDEAYITNINFRLLHDLGLLSIDTIPKTPLET